MARTKLSIIQKRKNDQLKKAKEIFKKENGLKIARGFKDSKEYKRINRNFRKSLSRYTKKRVGDDSVFHSIKVIESGAVFYAVLSYGSRAHKIAMDQFNLVKSVKKNFKAILDFDFFGLGYSTHLEQFSFDKKMQWLYKRLITIQENEGKYPIVSAVIGKFKKETYLLIKGIDLMSPKSK